MPRRKIAAKIEPAEIQPTLDALELPLIPLRDTVVFPQVVQPITIMRDRSVRAVEAALLHDSRVVVVTQRDASVSEPTLSDMFELGTVMTVGRMLRMPDGTINFVGQAEHRIRVLEIVRTDPYLLARVVPVFEISDRDTATEALMRAVLASYDKVVRMSNNIPDEAYITAMNAPDEGALADVIASSLPIEIAKRQEILEILDPKVRLQKISVVLAQELDVLELQNKINTQVQEEVDKSQREFYLREQMRVIQQELGEIDAFTRDLNELKTKLEGAALPAEIREKALHEIERLGQMPAGAPEVGIIRTYLDWLIALPWAQKSEDNLDISAAAHLLDEQHYALGKAKERILEYMAVRKLAAEKMRSPILCFVGPPGTGKTSMGRSIAQALGRNFVRVSLGGIRDEAEIRGHRRTYIGAMPGRIIQTMRRAHTINPVFMLDEIDKIGMDFRGDPSSALLEVLDPEQNFAFSDHYLEVAYDLSKVMFITTANMLDPVPPALRDRLEVIEFTGYIEQEKLAIARTFLVPRQKDEHGLGAKLKFPEPTLSVLVREYTYESGVRNLEREIANICRKVARLSAEGKFVPTNITVEAARKLLGPAKFSYGVAQEKDEVGVATGVAVTDAGGDTLNVEVTLMPGKGGLLLTGQLGDVMQESAQAALSYARAYARQLALRADFEKLDIHIHVPEGAIPKDGPSAGVTIATALISALSKRPVHKDVGLTGEITLRGRVLPIGGLREKVLAAHRAGLKTFVLPMKNKKDLVDIPKKVTREMNLIFVERMDEVLPIALRQAKARGRILHARARK